MGIEVRVQSLSGLFMLIRAQFLYKPDGEANSLSNQ